MPFKSKGDVRDEEYVELAEASCSFPDDGSLLNMCNMKVGSDLSMRSGADAGRHQRVSSPELGSRRVWCLVLRAKKMMSIMSMKTMPMMVITAPSLGCR
eukprot:2737200-Rhodomonas_salina.5